MPSISWNFTSMISMSVVCTVRPINLGLDRQFAVSAIDQHEKLHARRAAVIEERSSAARMVRPVYSTSSIRIMSLPSTENGISVALTTGLISDRAQIVAIQIDIQNSDRNLAIFQSLDFRGQPLRHGHAAAPNADERELIEILGLLQNLMGEADQRPIDL